MRPCGPSRNYGHSSVKSVVYCNYWTDMFRCGGKQVGGRFTLSMYPKDYAALQDAVKTGKDFQNIKEKAPAVYEKLADACYKQLAYDMAEDVYGDFDFSDPKFRGWRHDRKVRYIMSTADTDIRKEISIGFEITSY